MPSNLAKGSRIFPTFDESRMSRQRELFPKCRKGTRFQRNLDVLLVLISSIRVSHSLAFWVRNDSLGKRKAARKAKNAKNAKTIGVILVAVFPSRHQISGFIRRLRKPFSKHGGEASWSEPDAERACVKA